MATFEIKGPLSVPTYDGEAAKIVGSDSLSAFWDSSGVAEPRGCYLFAVRASKGIRPVCVGRATKNFKQEVFTLRWHLWAMRCHPRPNRFHSSAHRRTTCGRCRSPVSMRRARCAVVKCGASRTSRTVPTSGTYSFASAWTASRRAAPRHAGRRCGMRATRRWARVCKLSQTGPLTGIGRHNPQPTMRSTNASTGAVAKRRLRLAADRCCVRACPQAILRPKAWPFKWFDRAGNRRWWAL